MLITERTECLRLYRGLKEPHDPLRVVPRLGTGTDFTDCPYTALQYATGRKGVMLVLDVLPEDRRLTEELFGFNETPRRFMLWRAFEDLIVATVPAKELRAQARRKGIVTGSWQYKSEVLRNYIRNRGSLDVGLTISTRASPSIGGR